MKTKRINDLKRPLPTFVEVASFRSAGASPVCVRCRTYRFFSFALAVLRRAAFAATV